MIELCTQIPNLDGSKGCSVAEEWHSWLCGTNAPLTEISASICGIIQEICSKCIPVTKTLRIAREKWPCEGCDSGKITHTAQDEQYTCDCPECHGLGISREAFWEWTGEYEDGEKIYKPREPWEIIEKICGYKYKKIDAFYDDQPDYEIRGQFFQLIRLWNRLRDLTGEAGDGREK